MIRLSALVLGLALLTAPTFAQPASVSIDDALRIARTDGLSNITKAEFDDGRWEVYGRNAAGRRVEMYIHPHTGQILRRRTR